MVSRWFHTPKFVGSIPTLATKDKTGVVKVIPIYLEQDTIDQINKGVLEIPELITTLSEYLKYRMARFTIYDEKVEVCLKPMEYGSGKKVDYENVLSGLSDEEATFFVLLNSRNYYDEKFKCSTYNNDIVAYLIAYFDQDKIEELGKFLNNEQVDSENSADLKTGCFVFNDSKEFAKIKKKILLLKNKPNFKKANAKLVSTFCGDSEEIKEKTIKTTVDLLDSDSEKSRIEAAKILGNWFGIENRDTTVKVETTLQAIKTADLINNDGVSEIDKLLDEVE